MLDINWENVQFEELIHEVHRECPFCGNLHVTITTKQAYQLMCDNSDTGTACISINCNICNLILHEHSVNGRDNYELKRQTLLNKWNLGIHRRG